jgi:hypothetical protein
MTLTFSWLRFVSKAAAEPTFDEVKQQRELARVKMETTMRLPSAVSTIIGDANWDSSKKKLHEFCQVKARGGVIFLLKNCEIPLPPV